MDSSLANLVSRGLLENTVNDFDEIINTDNFFTESMNCLLTKLTAERATKGLSSLKKRVKNVKVISDHHPKKEHRRLVKGLRQVDISEQLG